MTATLETSTCSPARMLQYPAALTDGGASSSRAGKQAGSDCLMPARVR